MTEVLAATDIAAHPIVLKHLPTEIARTMLRFRVRHDYAPDRHTHQEEAALIVADAESFIALVRQLIETHA